MNCPHCHKHISPSDVGRAMQASGKSGRKAILKPCSICGKEFGVAAMRKHLPECRKAPDLMNDFNYVGSRHHY